MAQFGVVPKENGQQDYKNSILETTNALLRDVIAEAEPLAYRLAREWGPPSRRQAMEDLIRKSDNASAWLKRYAESEIIIAGGTAILGCLGSFRLTAWNARTMSSRVWGRSCIRQSLEHLKKLFGDGCVLSPLSPLPTKEPAQRAMQDAESKPTLPEYLSPIQVANILGVSRNTVVKEFLHYPGVIDITLTTKKKFQRQRMLRIPRGVLLRFIEDHRIR